MRDKKIYVLLAVAVFLIVVSILVISMDRPIEFKEIEARFIAGGDPAFDINGTALTFGRIPLEGTGTRNIILDNRHDFRIKIHIVPVGEIKDFISTNSSVILKPDENATIPIIVYIPRGTKEGEYAGQIKLITYRDD